MERSGSVTQYTPKPAAWHIVSTLLVILTIVGTFFSSVIVAEAADNVSVVVKLVGGLTLDEQSAVIARDGGAETSSIQALRLHVITVPTVALPLILQNYQSDTQVESVELNKSRKAEGAPGDLNYGLQWALSKIGWESLFGTVTPAPGSTAKLAILDTGIDASHPDLAAIVISGTSILDGTNGFSDPNGHGTSLAGIAAAITDNGIGIAGIGYAGVQIMPVTVLGANGLGQDSDIIAGIIWAADHGADVILMGFSNPDFSQNLQDAIDYAWSRGAVMVAATGNDGVSTPTFPAGDRGVVGVSASDESDFLFAGSNYGLDTFLAAPGANIYTTGLGSTYTSISGTSASSAVVAGVAAFMKAVDPSLTNGVIVGRLAKSADAIGPAGDPNNQTMFGNGRVNMANAIADTSTDSVQPAGADPVGNGGPYVGPYTAAAQRTVTTISSSSQSSTLTSGIAGTTTYTITVNTANGSPSTTMLSVTDGLPAGATASFPNPVSLTNPTFTTTMTVTTTAATPAGNSTLTIANSNNANTGNTTLVIGNASQASQAITVDNPAPANSSYGSTFNVAAHASSGLPVAITTSGSCSGSGSSTGAGSPVTVTMISGSGACTVNYNQAGNSSFNPAPQVPSSTNATTRPLTVTADTKSKIYGTTDPALTYTNSGLIGSDAVTGALARAAGNDVGTYAITQGTLTAGANYAIVFTGASLTITPATLTVTAEAKSKIYGAVDPALGFTTSGLIDSDAVTGALARAAGNDVGTYAITQGTLTAGANYAIAFTGASLTITPATLTVTAEAKSKIYGTSDPALGFTTSGLIGSDAVTGALARAAGNDVGTYAITQGTLTTGANYTIAFTGASLTITPATLTVTGFVASNKVYDGNTSATITGSGTLIGVVVGDIVTLSGAPVGAFSAPAVGNGKNVTISGISLTGAQVGNYTLTAPTATANITAKALTVTGLAASNKPFDGNTTAAITGTAALSGVVSGDTVNLIGTAVGTFADPVVGTGKAVTISGLSLSGDQAVNYTLTAPTATADIIQLVTLGTPASLTIPPTSSTGIFQAVWGASDVSGVTYVLDVSFNGGAYTNVYTGPNRYANISGLANGPYNYRVQAIKTDYFDSAYNTGSLTVELKCGAPASLTIPATNSTGSFQATWGASDVSGVTYVLEVSSTGINGAYSLAYSGPNTYANISGLANGTYYYRVQATKSGYGFNPSTAAGNSLVVELKCGAPASLTIPATNSTGSFQATWGASDVSGVTYVLEVSSTGVNGTYSLAYSGPNTYANISGLTNGTYYYRVQATKSGYGVNPPTAAGNSLVVELKCGAPASLTIPTNNSTGSFQAAWGASDVSGVTYVLEVSSTGVNGMYSPAYSGPNTNANISGLTNGTYYYRVQATKFGYGFNPPTAAGNSLVVELKCGAPASLTIPTNNSTGSFQATWGASDVSGVTYVLEVSSTGVNGTYSPAYSGPNTYANISGLTNGTYYYQVQATKSGYGVNPPTAAGNSLVVELKCGAPASLTIPTNNSTGSFLATWEASDVSGVTYTLQVSSDNGVNFTNVYVGPNTSANINGLANGTHKYRVQATKFGYGFNPPTASGNSLVVELKCGAPAYLTVPTLNSTGSFQATWGASDVSGVTYLLEVSSTGINGTYSIAYSGLNRYANISGLTNGTYYYRVQATKSGYASFDPTPAANTLTVTPVCGAPAYLTIPASSTTGSFQAVWGASDITSGVTYTLQVSSDNGANYTTVYSGPNKFANISGLANGTYLYRVQATKAGYASNDPTPASNPLTVLLTCGIPASITIPATNSTGSFQAVWGASDVTGVTYTLQVSSNGVNGTYTNVYTGLNKFANISGLANGTYYYRVQATKSGYLESGWRTSGALLVTH